MNGREPGGRLLLLLGASVTAALAVSACGPRADDINQVQPGYVRKSIFQQDSEWYYRRTVAKAETTNSYVVEGSGDMPLERIRWRIEENKLVAYKPYENVPGSEGAEYEGAVPFEGAVVASFPITSHFDIRRGYDAVTGNETNVIAENTLDRAWSEREFMRVDWATDELGGTFADNLYEFPFDLVSTAKFSQYIETDPTNEFAARFSDDYIEFSHTALVAMDAYTCLAFTGFSQAAYGTCGYGEAQIRHSFVRIREESDFIPRAYPDSVVRKGPDGKAITDPVTGEVLREPILSRFGYFRRELPTYDPGYGYTESGKLYRAMMFNIWKRHTDPVTREEIPCSLAGGCAREPKPVIYYLNAEYPPRWRKVAQEVAAEYDRVLKGLVQDLVGPERTPEHMFEIRDNDCNVGNIRSFAANNPDLEYAVARAVCRPGEACENPIEKVAFGNLTKVCTSLEAATRDETGKPAFDWQRIGDARFNMLVYLNNPQDGGWGGLGPMHSDSRTGETVSASSYIRGNVYETAASTVVDYIELINGQTSIEEVVFGQDIRRHASAVLDRGRRLANTSSSREYSELMQQRLERHGRGEEMLREVSPDYQLNRLKRAEGSRAEEAMITELDVIMASGGKWKPGQPISKELRELASPTGRATMANPASALRQKARDALSAAGFCQLEYDLDPHWAGLALALKDVPAEERYEIVASRLLKHVFLHELGHNFGLRHNFEGTYDALNYGDTFWSHAWGTEEDKIYYRIDEHRNSSVMEYVGQGKGAFSDYLGKYDEAAIRFAYGNQVAVFSSPKVNPALQGGEPLRAWRYMNDYMKLPEHICAPGACATPEDRSEALTMRAWQDFDPQNPPANEVPFLFCDNAYAGRTPFCDVFDYGSNMREIFANYYTNWSNYFFFNNFVRDRLLWNPGSAFRPLVDALGFVSTVGQYAYYFQSKDPTFAASDLGQDMLTTVANGLNMAAEVIATPSPIRMCPWEGTDPQVYIPHYFFDACDEYAPITSAYAIEKQAIQLPLGDARPATIGFTEDYEDYDYSYVGSYFDKSNVLILLGLNRPTFLRYNFDIDARTYDISLFRLFEPELRSFYDRVINLDGYIVNLETAEELGSYWCRNPASPDVAHLGYFEPRRMVDPSSARPVAPGPSAACAQSGTPALVYPELLRNMPFSAMFWAHGLFSSDFDSELDMGKSLKIYVVGADDDYPEWSNLPPEQICSVVDGLTGLEYRAIHQPAGIPDLGCRLISKADAAQRTYQGNPTNTFQKDRWRSWFERLEYARDLTRAFNR